VDRAVSDLVTATFVFTALVDSSAASRLASMQPSGSVERLTASCGQTQRQMARRMA
jgi:hypothetical protein